MKSGKRRMENGARAANLHERYIYAGGRLNCRDDPALLSGVLRFNAGRWSLDVCRPGNFAEGGPLQLHEFLYETRRRQFCGGGRWFNAQQR